jgi:hypothetical protein
MEVTWYLDLQPVADEGYFCLNFRPVNWAADAATLAHQTHMDCKHTSEMPSTKSLYCMPQAQTGTKHHTSCFSVHIHNPTHPAHAVRCICRRQTDRQVSHAQHRSPLRSTAAATCKHRSKATTSYYSQAPTLAGATAGVLPVDISLKPCSQHTASRTEGELAQHRSGACAQLPTPLTSLLQK